MPLTLRRLNPRLLIVQIGIVVCFLLMIGWFRLPRLPDPIPTYYNLRFVLFAAMLITIVLWFACGLPGFAALRRDKLRAAWALALLLLAAWAYASQTWGFVALSYPFVGADGALAWGITALFALVVAAAAPPPRVVAAALIASVVFSATITILQANAQGSLGLTGLSEFPFGADRAGTSLLRAGNFTYVRPYGLYPHPNIVGGALAVGALLAGAFAISLRGGWRWLVLAVTAVIVWALLLTFSRAAWIGLAAGAFVLLARLRLRWWALVPAALLALVIGAVFVAQYRPLLGARAGEGAESLELRSVSDRLVYTEFALRAIEERPIIGQGIGNFPYRVAVYLQDTFYDLIGDRVHHVYLSVWSELGVIGFGLFVMALALGIEAGLRRDPPAAHPADATARAALLAAVIALAIIGLFDHYPYSQLPLMALWWGGVAGMGQRAATPATRP
jgi:hypothetical protein